MDNLPAIFQLFVRFFMMFAVAFWLQTLASAPRREKKEPEPKPSVSKADDADNGGTRAAPARPAR